MDGLRGRPGLGRPRRPDRAASTCARVSAAGNGSATPLGGVLRVGARGTRVELAVVIDLADAAQLGAVRAEAGPGRRDRAALSPARSADQRHVHRAGHQGRRVLRGRHGPTRSRSTHVPLGRVDEPFYVRVRGTDGNRTAPGPLGAGGRPGRSGASTWSATPTRGSTCGSTPTRSGCCRAEQGVSSASVSARPAAPGGSARTVGGALLRLGAEPARRGGLRVVPDPSSPDAASCTCTCTPSTRCSTARRGSTTCSPRPTGMGMPALAMTDHGNVFGAYEFCKQGHEARRQADHRHRGLRHAGHRRFDQHPGPVGRRRASDDVSGGGAYTHMTLLAETTERHAQPVPALVAGLASRATTSSRAWTASCSQTYGEGPHRDHRLPVGRGPDPAAAGPVRRGRRAAAAEFRDIFGADNFFCELMDHGLDIERRVRDDLLRLAKRARPAAASPPTTCTTPTPRTPSAHEALLCVQSGSTLADPNRFKFDADDFYLKSAGRDAPASGRELPEACDNTLLDRRAVRRRSSPRARNFMPRFPVPDGRERGRPGSSRRSSAACTRRYPRRHPDEVRSAGRVRDRGHRRQWASRATSSSSPTSSTGPRTRASGSARAAARRPARWSRTRWASPTSTRSQHGLIFERFLNPERVVDARLRHRLRRAPARRGDPLRHREVRRATGSPRSSPTARSRPSRRSRTPPGCSGYPFAMGERITKAMPPAVMGKDIPLSGIFDPEHKRYGEAGEFRALYELRPGRREGRRHRQGPRGPQAPVGRARGRRDHVQRAAHRPHPDHAPRAGRRDHHPVRLPDLRDARPGQDGLPRPAQPHDPRRRAREHRAQPRRDRSTSRTLAAGRPTPTYELLARGDTLGRLPARRRPDAGAAAADAARQLRGHLRRRRALPAGPDGRQRAHQLRAAQERPAGDHADPPRAGRAARRDPRRRPTA